MFSEILSLGLSGLNAYIVKVEVDISNGLPGFDIVGLPDASVKESKDRVRSALKNCGYEFPLGRITVNLAPADTKKEGPIYDLPILLAILIATKQVNADLSDCAFVGELSLTGEIRPVNGILSIVTAAKSAGIKKIYIPFSNIYEGSVVENIKVFGIKNLTELTLHLNKSEELLPVYTSISDIPLPESSFLDFSDVKGQFEAKRALEIAASGGHNVLLIGPPGSGKSMLTKRLPSILPDMTFDESIETTKIHSISGNLPQNMPIVRIRPFRSPHHTVSPAALAGGGSVPRPGDISLAHNGVLFLDELPEFNRNTLEALRQPIEDRQVTISRVSGILTYPCDFMLVCAMNPCPCGYFGHPTKKCICSKKSADNYLSRISGPLLDRIDLHVEVPPVEYEELSSKNSAESSSEIKKRVTNARNIQIERFKKTSIICNANMSSAETLTNCILTKDADDLLKQSFDLMGLSARAYTRILKVSRTIADLDSSENISIEHISEALQYRSLDRKYWK